LELASLKVLLAGIVCQTEGPAALDADRFDKVIEAARAASPSHRKMSFGANPLHFLVSKCNFIVRNCASGVFARARNFWLMVEHRSDLAKKAAHWTA
jgi:hypothetical protein